MLHEADDKTLKTASVSNLQGELVALKASYSTPRDTVKGTKSDF